MFRSAINNTILTAARPAVSRQALRPVLARAYHENVISHYERPRNVGGFLPSRLAYLITPIQVGSLPKGDADVGTGLVGAPA